MFKTCSDDEFDGTGRVQDQPYDEVVAVSDTESVEDPSQGLNVERFSDSDVNKAFPCRFTWHGFRNDVFTKTPGW